MSFRRSAKPRPVLPHEALARLAAFPRPQYREQNEEQIDTRPLQFRKIHPEVVVEFRKWLRQQPCAIAGLIDDFTGQEHVCWSPDLIGPNRFASDPAHIGKAYSGRLKRTDVAGMIALCRLAHRLQEDAMDRFDRRFGINRHELAALLWARFCRETHREECAGLPA